MLYTCLLQAEAEQHVALAQATNNGVESNPHKEQDGSSRKGHELQQELQRAPKVTKHLFHTLYSGAVPGEMHNTACACTCRVQSLVFECPCDARGTSDAPSMSGIRQYWS